MWRVLIAVAAFSFGDPALSSLAADALPLSLVDLSLPLAGGFLLGAMVELFVANWVVSLLIRGDVG